MVALTFSHIGITVPDLEKAVEFYSKAFDLYVIMGRPKSSTMKVPSGRCATTCSVRDGGLSG